MNKNSSQRVKWKPTQTYSINISNFFHEDKSTKRITFLKKCYSTYSINSLKKGIILLSII